MSIYIYSPSPNYPVLKNVINNRIILAFPTLLDLETLQEAIAAYLKTGFSSSSNSTISTELKDKITWIKNLINDNDGNFDNEDEFLHLVRRVASEKIKNFESRTRLKRNLFDNASDFSPAKVQMTGFRSTAADKCVNKILLTSAGSYYNSKELTQMYFCFGKKDLKSFLKTDLRSSTYYSTFDYSIRKDYLKRLMELLKDQKIRFPLLPQNCKNWLLEHPDKATEFLSTFKIEQFEDFIQEIPQIYEKMKTRSTSIDSFKIDIADILVELVNEVDLDHVDLVTTTVYTLSSNSSYFFNQLLFSIRGHEITSLTIKDSVKGNLDLCLRSCPNLETLNLSENSINNSILEKLIAAEALPKLKNLILCSCGIDDQGAKLIAKAKCFASLEQLNLRNNKIFNPGVIEIANSPYLNKLTHLQLGTNLFNHIGLKAVLLSSRLLSLEDLSLFDTPIIFSQALKDGTTLRFLKEINLSSCALSSEEAVLLSKLYLPMLSKLILSHNNIQFDGAMALAQSLTLPSLTEMTLLETLLSQEDKILIRKVLSYKTNVMHVMLR